LKCLEDLQRLVFRREDFVRLGIGEVIAADLAEVPEVLDGADQRLRWRYTLIGAGNRQRCRGRGGGCGVLGRCWRGRWRRRGGGECQEIRVLRTVARASAVII